MRITIASGIMLLCLALTACGQDYEPREKKAVYDPVQGELQSPYPCPDWSHSTVWNQANAPYSNYGCAVENNIGVQLENPRDLALGHGTKAGGPDTELSIDTIGQYRAGKIPVALIPQQSISQ